MKCLTSQLSRETDEVLCLLLTSGHETVDIMKPYCKTEESKHLSCILSELMCHGVLTNNNDIKG